MVLPVPKWFWIRKSSTLIEFRLNDIDPVSSEELIFQKRFYYSGIRFTPLGDVHDDVRIAGGGDAAGCG